MNENHVKFGSGITVWCILCIIAGIGASITNLVNGLILLALVSLVNVGVYLWLLLKKKKLAFYIIVGMVTVIFLVNVVLYRVSFIFSLLGFVNPVITYVLLSKYWGQMD